MPSETISKLDFLKRASLRLFAIALLATLAFECLCGMVENTLAQEEPERAAKVGRKTPPITVADVFTPIVARVLTLCDSLSDSGVSFAVN